MSVNDPIADMLTRIRNGVMQSLAVVAMPSSKVKIEIARILKKKASLKILKIQLKKLLHTKVLRLKLKYVGERRQRQSVITGLQRISRPGKRVYSGRKEIPWVLSGMGIAIVSTPKGVMTGQKARSQGVGGEILCKVW